MSLSDSEFSSLTNALVYDMTQPCIFDNSCFARIIRRELSAYVAPTIVEFGCGTGLLAMKLLSTMDDCAYYGIDASTDMLAVFKRHLATLRNVDHRITLVGPVDLRRKGAVSTAFSMTADAAVMSQFLQYLPLRPESEDHVSKPQFLAQCIALTRPGGRLVIIEDVCGETAAESLALSSAWDAAALAQYADRLSVIEAGLRDVAPAFAKAIEQMIAHPALIRLMRERRRAARGEEIMSLSAWKQMLARTGLTYRVFPHESLRNFYLFMVES